MEGEMKTYVKKEQKKYPYKKHRPLFKSNLFAQIRAREQRIKEKLPQYTIIDSKGKVIEKYRIRVTAQNEIKKIRNDYYEELRICKLDSNGNVGEVIFTEKIKGFRVSG